MRPLIIRWLQDFDNDHRDSTWYGGDIVDINLGRYSVTIGAFGEIRAKLNGEYYCDKNNGGCFRDFYKEQGIYNDSDLKRAIQEGRVEFGDNNWYEAIIWDNKKKEYVDSWDCVLDDDLDRNDNFSWVRGWLKQLVN